MQMHSSCSRDRHAAGGEDLKHYFSIRDSSRIAGLFHISTCPFFQNALFSHTGRIMNPKDIPSRRKTFPKIQTAETADNLIQGLTAQMSIRRRADYSVCESLLEG
jgi:hypothetical protein